jgi:hypothetical protein
MNKKIGIYSSMITFSAVLSFFICMLLGLILQNDDIHKMGSSLSSIFIAFGFVSMICSFNMYANKDNKLLGLIALSFSIMYAILIVIVYYAQITTIRLMSLSEEIAGLLDYSKFGLFFNYNLLGYSFMSLSTFFIGFKLETKNRQENILRYLLCIHGIFFVGCFTMPIFGIFNATMNGGEIIGTIVLGFWCIYFMPVCFLSYKYFKEK